MFSGKTILLSTKKSHESTALGRFPGLTPAHTAADSAASRAGELSVIRQVFNATTQSYIIHHEYAIGLYLIRHWTPSTHGDSQSALLPGWMLPITVFEERESWPKRLSLLFPGTVLLSTNQSRGHPESMNTIKYRP